MEMQNKYGLQMFHQQDKIEIGIDEAGRGPLFGRLYVAAVVLPKDGSFDFSNIRDSKKIKSKKK
jgi:ribonuclease HII